MARSPGTEKQPVFKCYNKVHLSDKKEKQINPIENTGRQWATPPPSPSQAEQGQTGYSPGHQLDVKMIPLTPPRRSS